GSPGVPASRSSGVPAPGPSDAAVPGSPGVPASRSSGVPAPGPSDAAVPGSPGVPASGPSGVPASGPPDAAAPGQSGASVPGQPDASVPVGPPAPQAVASAAGTGSPRTGVAALSPRYQVGAVLALAVVAAAVCAHIGLTFLHVAPANTLSKQHGSVVDEWVYPEFEQNWKLFAPNPLQQNISVQVRAEVSTSDGGIRTTGWYDLSAEDGRAIDGNLLPSHTQQNELRRAWDFFVATHDSDNRPVGLRGTLSETYLRRVAVLRLDRNGAAGPGGAVQRVQYRSRTTNVPPPEWSGEKVSDRPVYRELPWWRVPADEAEGGVA
ncbi:DUF5819 family protein, partial [Streptomyces sp. NPDC048219]|uniref:DUF5819 family protein n=1 Tax=Streptomyces sp. NPDC048219 TaxID=3365517 RepID=UPI0037156B89